MRILFSRLKNRVAGVAQADMGMYSGVLSDTARLSSQNKTQMYRVSEKLNYSFVKKLDKANQAESPFCGGEQYLP